MLLSFLPLVAIAAAPTVADVRAADLPAGDVDGLAVDRLEGSAWRYRAAVLLSSCGAPRAGELRDDVATVARTGGRLELRTSTGGDEWAVRVPASDRLELAAADPSGVWTLTGALTGSRAELRGLVVYAGRAPCATVYDVTLTPLR